MVLMGLKGLRHVRVEKGAMPGITQVTMGELPLLEELPFGVENLRQLQEMELWSMNSNLTNNLRNAADTEEGGEENRKIARVPQVTIGYLQDGVWECHKLSRETSCQVKKESLPKIQM
ncbi:OLC1v1016084C1 [Oldenlandia corymbosa var. corymbosa]|uniref:OLC1v1016084C1 n=1 Tax=Oldenlandia corymbosa var. corymbosa TaxID=529605 RepID=A0AAV1E6P2_OLDCO|nr:OLC1v1016084C1 [Oldenlandia corymbosa var. corymbosa]